MIFYGRRASRLKDGRINNVTCPDCDALTSYTYSIFGKYAHIYWVPLFPMGKETILECDNCKRTYKAAEVSDTITQKLSFERQGAKTPLWNFAGIGVIACIVCLIIYIGKADKAKEAEYITDPQIGDVYGIKGNLSGYYAAMKVTKVTGDSVYVIHSDFEIDQKSSLSDINKDEFYTTQLDTFSRAEILSFYEEQFIHDIKRD